MKPYLDIWIADKLGVEKLTREDIEAYRTEKLKETFEMAASRSPFYASLYEGMQVESMEDFRKLPFTTPDDVCEHGLDMLCVSQGQISRIVTMETSGTTGRPKRIYFTAEDQELTVDFFHHGMKLLVDETDVFMILMPCQRPGSIGVLLKEALERSGVKVVPYGLPNGSDTEKILSIMEREGVTSCVALATQLAQIADEFRKRAQLCDFETLQSTSKYSKSANGTVCKYDIKMKTVLLSAEYVSEESRNKIEAAWGCKIFEHYGMTEMGLGCAVHCPEIAGCHIRECDLYLEIIDPITGEVLPDGEEGEIVFTTLTRRGMPFIRYRTGDWSRFINEPCGCGSVLKSLSRVGDRGIKKGGNHGR